MTKVPEPEPSPDRDLVRLRELDFATRYMFIQSSRVKDAGHGWLAEIFDQLRADFEDARIAIDKRRQDGHELYPGEDAEARG